MKGGEKVQSIVSYPERGPYGDAKYRGNCTGYLIKDLLLFYKPRNFLECFAGSGTGYEVARELGYKNSVHLDLNERFGQFNILTDRLPQNVQFTFSHPPYWNIIKYSGKGNVWGNTAHHDDLSHIENYDIFISKLDIINRKIYDSLAPEGRHAILIGDVRRQGKYYSIMKDMKWFGLLESHIIKTQHNTAGERKQYANQNFIPIVHEHLLIFKKDK